MIDQARIEGTPPAGLSLFTGVIPDPQQAQFFNWLEQHARWNPNGKRKPVEIFVRDAHVHPGEDYRVFPPHLQAVIDELHSLGILQEEVNYAHAIRYRAGDGIGSHIDNSVDYGRTITGLTLGSSAVMTLQLDANTKARILLRPGDIYQLSGEARYHWVHGIDHTNTDSFQGKDYPRDTRISVTLRKRKNLN